MDPFLLGEPINTVIFMIYSPLLSSQFLSVSFETDAGKRLWETKSAFGALFFKILAVFPIWDEPDVANKKIFLFVKS